MRSTALAGVALALVALAGCGGTGPAAAPAGPEVVALAYTEALLAGRYAVARNYVDVRDHPVYDAMTDGLVPGQVVGRDLGAAPPPAGDSATMVVLTGDLCIVELPTSGTDATATSVPGRCEHNVDPEPTAANAPFHVPVGRNSDGMWKVRLPLPTAPQASTGSSDSAGPSASGSDGG